MSRLLAAALLLTLAPAARAGSDPLDEALFDKAKVLPNSPERDRLYRQMDALLFAYAPVRPISHRILTGLAQPWVVGYRRNPIKRDFWQYLDIDEQARRAPHAQEASAAAGPAR